MSRFRKRSLQPSYGVKSINIWVLEIRCMFGIWFKLILVDGYTIEVMEWVHLISFSLIIWWVVKLAKIWTEHFHELYVGSIG